LCAIPFSEAREVLSSDPAQVYHAARQRGSTDGYRPYTGAIRDAFGDVGHPKLRQHLEGVVMLMKYSPDWRVFMDRFDKEYSQWALTTCCHFLTTTRHQKKRRATEAALACWCRMKADLLRD
jgi:hypothetical protein